MSFLSKMLGLAPDPREQMRPLWHRVIELARDRSYYEQCGVADSVDGRFDMITAILSVVIVRVEAADMRSESALLAELFVEDMDGQLREFGVNDVVVGKRVGKLMSVLGGRLGAYRSALVSGDSEKLAEATARNVTFMDGKAEAEAASCVANKLQELSVRLAAISDDDLIKAERVS
ncbi:MAG: ubiquinol-cytochrome C chaperone family protein [Pseudomonadota bacterium]